MKAKVGNHKLTRIRGQKELMFDQGLCDVMMLTMSHVVEQCWEELLMCDEVLMLGVEGDCEDMYD